MKSIRYFVCSCTECNSIVLMKIDFLEFENECCLEFKNHRILKEFNDENEAKNYIKLLEKEEE